MTDAETLRGLWEGAYGPGSAGAGQDPGATRRPAADAGDATLSGLGTLAATLSGGRTTGGTLSGGATIGRSDGTAPAATVPAGYDLLGEVGRGGMGVVYRARQRALARDIALKFIKPEAAGGTARDRFVSEALVNGLLDHPNIVPVHELGADPDGEVYLAMKLVGGRSWKQLLHPQTAEDRAAAASCDLDRHLAILHAVGNAVAFAHSRGIVHRDLKPENVMVGEFGEVLVMDWGIAVDIRDQPGEDRRAQHKSTVTAPSGTPSYMAPELAEGRGRDISPATDVYLLGAILHEVLTGAPPHRGRTLLEVLVAASRSEAPAYGPAIPAGLAAIAITAMAREPQARFPSIAEFQAALARFAKHRDSERIADAARGRLEQADAAGAADDAARNRRYADYAEAVAGFRQALVLWDANPRARTGEREARLAYGRAALAGGDLGLANAQIEELAGDEADGLRTQVAAARADAHARTRAATRNRRLLAGSAVLLIAGLGTGVALVNAERSRTAGERDKAEEARTRAERAQAAEAESRALAEKRQGEAQEQRDKAVAAERLAQEQREAADKARLAAQETLVRSLLQRAREAGGAMAAVWEASALRTASGLPEHERILRRRLAARLGTQAELLSLHLLPGAIDGAALREPWGKDPVRCFGADGARALLETRAAWPAAALRVWDLDRGVALSDAWDQPVNVTGPALWFSADGGLRRAGELGSEKVRLPDGMADGISAESAESVEVDDFFLIHGVPSDAERRRPALPLTGKLGRSWVSPDRTIALLCIDDERKVLVDLGARKVLWERKHAGTVNSVAWTTHAVLLRAEEKSDEDWTPAIVRMPLAASGAVDSWGLGPEWDGSLEGLHALDDDGRRVLLELQSERMRVLHLADLMPAGDGPQAGLVVPRGATLPVLGKVADVRRRGDALRVVSQPETFGLGGYGFDHTLVYRWKLPEAPPLAVPLIGDLRSVAASADGRVAAVVAGGGLRFLALPDVRMIGAQIGVDAAKPVTLSLDAAGRRCAIGQGGVLRVVEVATGAPVGTPWNLLEPGRTVDPDEDPTPLFSLSRDGGRLVARTDQGGMRWREIPSGRSGGIDDVVGGSTDADLVIDGERRIVRPWDPAFAPVQLEVPAGHPFQFADASRDGRRVLAVSGFKETPTYARVWDTGTGKAVSREWNFQMYPIGGVFSPDGARVAIQVMDEGVRLWDIASGEPLTRGLGGGIMGADLRNRELTSNGSPVFSPDGRMLVMSASDGTSWYDTILNEQVLYVPGSPSMSAVIGVQVLGDGARLPQVLADGSVLGVDGRRLAVGEDDREPDTLVALTAIRAGRRIDASGTPIDVLPADLPALVEQLRRAAPTSR